MKKEVNSDTKESRKWASMAFIADYLGASSAAQRTMIRRAKHDDSEFVFRYYRDCRAAIARYIKSGRDPKTLDLEVSLLEDGLEDATPQSEARLKHNIRAIAEFRQIFGDMDVDFQKQPRCPLSICGVNIPTTPDLHYSVAGKERFARLVYSAHPIDESHMKVFHHLVFTSLCEADISVRPNQVDIVALHSNDVFTLSRPSKRLAKNVEAACQTISNVWETV